MQQPSLFPEAGRYRIGAGPRHAEGLLFDDLDEALKGAGRALLSRPAVVVVPSRSLRLHLLGRLMARRGRALAGLTCTTHFGLAASLLSAAEGRPTWISALTPLLVRRLGRREKSLRQALDHLTDGYATLTGSVGDLLEAGFHPAHREAIEEALAEDGPAVASAGEVERARALVRVAAETLGRLEALGLDRASTVLERAADLVRAGGPPGFQPSGLFVYGYSDATGVVTDFLQALLDRHEGVLYLDHPPDPSRPGEVDPGVVFERRFRERLTAQGSKLGGGAAPPRGARLELFRALGGEAEVREVARRILARIAAGAEPELIGVVARDLRQIGPALRTHFERLGLPFSAHGALGAAASSGRRARAVLDLLTLGVEAPLERWLDARVEGFGGVRAGDLLTAFFAMGAGRLGELARLDLDASLGGRAAFSLPVRQGFSAPSDDDDAGRDRGAVRLRKRKVAAEALREAARAAGAVVERLERWRRASGVEEHRDHLFALLSGDLAWPADDPLAAEITRRLEAGLAGVPGGFEIELVEWVTLLRDLLATVGRPPLGGAGGGVQVLDVTEARGLTFEHLFVLGLNRGVFPRVVREDPLLPDSLRGVLGRTGHGVLPDLALKRSGADEERLLFAQLLAAAPRVTLSWLEVDDDNHSLARSPLVERLRWSVDEAAAPPTARHALGIELPADDTVPPPERPAYEHLVEAALQGRRGLEPLLATALAETRTDVTGDDRELRSIAAARLRILAELDPDLGTAAGRAVRADLGPYFGFVGRPSDQGDPRSDSARVYVTTLERLCGCPWQTFLERVLRLEVPPDPLDALPFATPLMIGDLVHRVAECVIKDELGEPPETLAEAVARPPGAVAWPEGEELDALAGRLAVHVARDQGIAVPGFARLLTAIARPYLHRLGALGWPRGRALDALAAELTTSVAVEIAGGIHRELWFKADRIDRGPKGLRLTDYKTGKRVVSRAKSERGRRKHLLEAVQRGERLQAAAYALAAGGPADEGRYLFIHPELDAPPEAALTVVRGRDGEIAIAFRAAAAAALEAWERGTFFPRLLLPGQDKEPVRCRFCDVAEACLRGDSGSRGRLRDWTDRAGQRGDPAAAAIAGVWQLGRPDPR